MIELGLEHFQKEAEKSIEWLNVNQINEVKSFGRLAYGLDLVF